MYTLIWSARALNQLAEIYVTLAIEEQRRMAAAVEAFNHRLTTRPSEEGQSRAGDLRIAFPAGLAVRFRVDEAAQVVRVTNVKRYGR
jgi:plasmid stabilization system protein ParE